ncbi:hypothetical protein BDR04DRAFT_1232569 [Suillus decipiens]|nr:hypothetical protein BDR04DRAFT_1232569 [Suillus decipiens]
MSIVKNPDSDEPPEFPYSPVQYINDDERTGYLSEADWSTKNLVEEDEKIEVDQLELHVICSNDGKKAKRRFEIVGVSKTRDCSLSSTNNSTPFSIPDLFLLFSILYIYLHRRPKLYADNPLTPKTGKLGALLPRLTLDDPEASEEGSSDAEDAEENDGNR